MTTFKTIICKYMSEQGITSLVELLNKMNENSEKQYTIQHLNNVINGIDTYTSYLVRIEEVLGLKEGTLNRK